MQEIENIKNQLQDDKLINNDKNYKDEMIKIKMMRQNTSNLVDFSLRDCRGFSNDDRRKHFYKGLKDSDFHHYYDSI